MSKWDSTPHEDVRSELATLLTALGRLESIVNDETRVNALLTSQAEQTAAVTALARAQEQQNEMLDSLASSIGSLAHFARKIEPVVNLDPTINVDVPAADVTVVPGPHPKGARKTVKRDPTTDLITEVTEEWVY